MFRIWRQFQRWPWKRRIALKTAVLGMTILAVCFPVPSRLIRHIQRWSNPAVLIDPHSPALEPMMAELSERLENITIGPDALKVVEKYVYEVIPYAWDWDTWGVADYLPTVEEAIWAGREDCDGRAVVAASLMSKLGYQCELVTDMSHVWVKTDYGETMSPGQMDKLVESGDDGTRVNWSALANVPRSLALGVAVFPLMRELIVLAVFATLAIRAGLGWRRWMVGVLIFADGLILLRWGGQNVWQPDSSTQWFGFLNMMLGVMILCWRRWDWEMFRKT